MSSEKGYGLPVEVGGRIDTDQVRAVLPHASGLPEVMTKPGDVTNGFKLARMRGMRNS